MGETLLHWANFWFWFPKPSPRLPSLGSPLSTWPQSPKLNPTYESYIHEATNELLLDAGSLDCLVGVGAVWP